MNTTLNRRIAILSAMTLAAAGVLLTPAQAAAHTKKTTVSVASYVSKSGIVKISWKYSGTAPKTQSLRVYGPQGTLNSMNYSLERNTRSFTFSNLTPDLHYRFVLAGTGPSVRGSIELTTPRGTTTGGDSTGTTPAPQPSPTPTTPSTTPTTPTPTKPGAPTALAATSTDNSATLTWTAPQNTTVVGYNVEMRVTGGSFFKQGTTATTTHTVNALYRGSTYEFRVATVTAAGVSDFTAPITVVPGTTPGANPGPSPTPTPVTGTPTQTPPQAPSGLAAIATQTTGTVRLNWIAPVAGATPTRYRVELASATSGWVSAGDTPSNGTAVDISSLTVGSTYQFRISSVAGEVVSAPSAPISYTVPAVNVTVPSAVRNLQGTASGTSAALSWTAPENTSGLPVSSHKLQVSGDALTWINLTDGNSATAANLTGLESNRRYYFRVAAVTSAGVGAWSTPVSVQVP